MDILHKLGYLAWSCQVFMRCDTDMIDYRNIGFSHVIVHSVWYGVDIRDDMYQ